VTALRGRRLPRRLWQRRNSRSITATARNLTAGASGFLRPLRLNRLILASLTVVAAVAEQRAIMQPAADRAIMRGEYQTGEGTDGVAGRKSDACCMEE
jgi:hypothetical protein